jgi:hypothetical protein
VGLAELWHARPVPRGEHVVGGAGGRYDIVLDDRDLPAAPGQADGGGEPGDASSDHHCLPAHHDLPARREAAEPSRACASDASVDASDQSPINWAESVAEARIVLPLDLVVDVLERLVDRSFRQLSTTPNPTGRVISTGGEDDVLNGAQVSRISRGCSSSASTACSRRPTGRRARANSTKPALIIIGPSIGPPFPLTGLGS